MSSLFVKNASSIVTCDEQDTVLENAGILIRNGAVAYIGPEPQQADETLDASGCVVYPGLINTHHHLYQTFSRNLPQVQNLELFDWLRALYEIWKNLDRETIYHSSIVGMGELLKTGCTTVFDHHYVFPGGSSGALLEGPGRADVRLPGEHGPEQKGRRPSAGQRGSDRGRDSPGLPKGGGEVPRPLPPLHADGSPGPLLPLQRLGGAAAPVRPAGPEPGGPAPHPPL